jgi:hypothetical protein
MSITLSGAFEEALSVLERSLTSSRCLRNGMRHYQMNLERKAESLTEPKLTPQISLLNRLASCTVHECCARLRQNKDQRHSNAMLSIDWRMADFMHVCTYLHRIQCKRHTRECNGNGELS